MKNKLIFAAGLLINLSFIMHLFAQDVYTIQAEKSKINVSVKYLVASKLVGNFKNFEGSIGYNAKDMSKTNVNLIINTESIQTEKPSLSRFIRSRRLLHVKKYPLIHFKSNEISQKNNKYYLKGILNLHGIKKEVSFIFDIENINSDEQKSQFLKSTGSCRLNRKDFKIIWSKIFDKGGIIVRNSILIEWEIIAVKMPSAKGSE